MKKKYFVYAILFVICFNTSTKAQLNGNYTVGGASPDFVDIVAAINAVYSFTVSGPVTFNIRPGYYSATVNLYNFAPSSIVTFQSESGNPDDVLFPMSTIFNSTNATFKKLSWNPLLNTSFMYPYKGMEISISDHILFDSCKIIGLPNPLNRYGITVLRSGGFIEIRNCSFYNLECGVSFSGNTYGGSRKHESFNCIENCNFDSLTTAMHISGDIGGWPDDTLSIKGNIIVSSVNGIVLTGQSGAGNLSSVFIEKNNIVDATGKGMYLYYNHPSIGYRPMTVRNNMVSGGLNSFLTSSTASGTITAKTRMTVDIDDAKYLVFENNTINGTVWLNDMTSAVFRNNCVASDSLMSLYVGSVITLTSDYNNLYTQYAPILAFVNSTLYPALDSLQSDTGQEINSISVYPWYYSETDLHSNSPYMQFAATPLPTITDDFDLESRDISIPDIGADEYHSSPLPPFAWFDYICLGGGTIQFNNVSVRDSSSSWDFGDGNFSSSTSPTHTYASIGTYNIKLVVNNSYGLDTFYYSFNLPSVPIISISGSVLSVSASYTSYQWYLNGVAILGETNNTCTGIASGNYTVEVMQGTGCTAMSLPLAYVGIDEAMIASKEIKLSPNPVINSFQIDLTSFGNSNICIYNALGQIVYILQGASGVVSIDKKEFASSGGMYFVGFTSGNNRLMKKIVVN